MTCCSCASRPWAHASAAWRSATCATACTSPPVKSSLLTQGREDAAQTGAAATTPRESAQRPDAASDMARQAEARRKADVLNGMLLRGRDLPHADPDVERRYRELLRVLEPVTSQKM